MNPEQAWWGGMWLFPVLTPILMVLFFAFFIYLFTRRGNGIPSWQDSYRPGRHEGESALDILKKRYAKGEISQSEFERMKRMFCRLPDKRINRRPFQLHAGITRDMSRDTSSVIP